MQPPTNRVRYAITRVMEDAQEVGKVVESLFQQPVERDEPRGITAMSRDQLVAGIIAVNPTATSDFLASFERDTLAGYLERLSRLRGPSARGTRWVRPDGQPAMMCHTPRV